MASSVSENVSKIPVVVSTMQCCGTKFCPWPRAAGRRSCCHKCRERSGRIHARYCIARSRNATTQNADSSNRDHGYASRISANATSIEDRDVDVVCVDNGAADATALETDVPTSAGASGASGDTNVSENMTGIPLVVSTMQCGGNRFCAWPRAAGRKSCCHKCRETSGRKHAFYCIARSQNTRSQDVDSRNRDYSLASRIPANVASVENRDVDVVSVDNGNADAMVLEIDDQANVRAPAATSHKCIICYVSDTTHAFVPCGHRCVCKECASIVVFQAQCPICRSWVQSSLRIYD